MSDSTVAQSKSARRVNRSCLICTKRKVKCDGGQPCSNCERHGSADACDYRQRTKRQVISKRCIARADFEGQLASKWLTLCSHSFATNSTHQQLTNQLQHYANFVQRIFPGLSLEQLNAKDALELAQIAAYNATSPGAQQPPFAPPSKWPPPSPDDDDDDDTGLSSHGSDSGELVGERTWDEAALRPPHTFGGDDNNAFNLAMQQQQSRGSFMGVTSNGAVLRTIFRLVPSAKIDLSAKTKLWEAEDPLPSPLASSLGQQTFGGAGLDEIKEQRFVDLFFNSINIVTPLVDEAQFRDSLKTGRQDPSWLGLQYMVFTLGSIASGSSTLHDHYYRRAQMFLNFETLGTGNVESLQALCLLGGFYLHFRNSPNMAFAVLGAAQRMAIALGLHREPRRRRMNSPDDTEGPEKARRTEANRRVWWNLFCVDVSRSMALGRPTCGRWDPVTMDTKFPTPNSPEDYPAITTGATCRFAMICNRIQHRFAQLREQVTAQEVLAFDTEIQNWYSSLPEILQSSADGPPRLAKYRYYTRQSCLEVRLIILRTAILRLSSSRNRTPPSPEELEAVNKCHAVACELVDAVAFSWAPNSLTTWNAAWNLFQASLTPLLCIAIGEKAAAIDPPGGSKRWEACVNRAMSLYSEMRPWMRPSDRSPEILATLLQSIKSGENVVPAVVDQYNVSMDPGFSRWFGEQIDWNVELDWDLLQQDMENQAGFPPL